MKKNKVHKTIHRLKWTRSSANNFETVQDTAEKTWEPQIANFMGFPNLQVLRCYDVQTLKQQ